MSNERVAVNQPGTNDKHVKNSEQSAQGATKRQSMLVPDARIRGEGRVWVVVDLDSAALQQRRVVADSVLVAQWALVEGLGKRL